MFHQTKEFIKKSNEQQNHLLETSPQGYIDFVTKQDRYYKLSLETVSNWNNHLILLYLSLELTIHNTNPIAEFGCGEGSTNNLRNFCDRNRKLFFTYDSDKDWANKYNSMFIEDWSKADIFKGPFSVVLLDLAPGEYRKIALERLCGNSDIIVLHDSEIGGAGDYQVEEGLSKYKYRINYNLTQGGAGVSAVSDTIDLNKFDKCTLNGYLLEV